MSEYVVAVRTYLRSHIFPHKTYSMLKHNGLTDCLYIFVASTEEKALYEHALEGQPYKEIIVGLPGGANAIRAICSHFPIGQRIAFIDDDHDSFFEYDQEGKIRKNSDNLKYYLNDGFAMIDTHNCGAFTFSFIQNAFWLRKKEFKEIRPFTLAGSFFCTRNQPELITTDYSHGDDIVRSVRYLDRYGGVLVYWKAGFVTKYGTLEGGLQSSGDRGSDTLKTTHDISWAEYLSDPLLQCYAHPPKQEKTNPFVSMKMKSLAALRKAMRDRKVECRENVFSR